MRYKLFWKSYFSRKRNQRFFDWRKIYNLMPRFNPKDIRLISIRNKFLKGSSCIIDDKFYLSFYKGLIPSHVTLFNSDSRKIFTLWNPFQNEWEMQITCTESYFKLHCFKINHISSLCICRFIFQFMKLMLVNLYSFFYFLIFLWIRK